MNQRPRCGAQKRAAPHTNNRARGRETPNRARDERAALFETRYIST
ncbi:hypothetical protein BSIN_0442 [Burkholderia singularis]|uniref:Uncharacterized protein n=1 Tax=Burkholderia singularis TaxID=1503053 RepID=A0A238H6F2_9BURK|nr:hypothetical protein BSIN_0442 [Burkholderia singularis]